MYNKRDEFVQLINSIKSELDSSVRMSLFYLIELTCLILNVMNIYLYVGHLSKGPVNIVTDCLYLQLLVY